MAKLEEGALGNMEKDLEGDAGEQDDGEESEGEEDGVAFQGGGGDDAGECKSFEPLQRQAMDYEIPNS